MAGYFSKTDFTPSTSNTYTVSFWVKINNFAPTTTNVPYLWSISDSDPSGLFFQGDTTPHNITFYRNNGNTRFSPTVYMRDVNAWYHIHLKVSSGTGTLYYNGESVKTSITVDAQNYNGGGAEHYIHTYGGGLSSYDNLECVMSHFHFVDGTAYDPTAFGETDSTTGEWKIKTNPSVNYGTNGYFILKDGNTGTDHSGNGNNFTLTGTCTKTEDCPSNVFATLNPLVPTGGGFQSNSSTFANGNTKFTTNNSSSNYGLALSTLGMTTGKYYAECKKISGGQGTIGIRGWQGTSTNNYLGDTPKDYAMYTNGRVYSNNSIALDTSTSYADDDIIGVFVDCDNWKIYWSKNGTMMNTTGVTIGDITTDTNPRSLGAYFFGCCEWNSSGNGSWEWNFGNGAFGSTQLTGTTYNGSDGNGIFKYDPNNITLDSTSKSFKSLSTKGLNT